MTALVEREAVERLLDGDTEEGGGVRPSVCYADHSYPAYSRKQMIDFAMRVAALRPRLAEYRRGVEDAARVADAEVADIEQHAHLADDGWQRGRLAMARGIVTAIRALSDSIDRTVINE